MSAATLDAQYCTFWVDGLCFGLGVQDVQEVLRFQGISAAPRAPQSVSGLLNLRGQIVTAIDLRVRLGLQPRPRDAVPMNVVIRSRGEVVSLLVDDIGDVIDTADTALEPVPPTLVPTVREALSGVIPLPNSILLILDADQAADVHRKSITTTSGATS